MKLLLTILLVAAAVCVVFTGIVFFCTFDRRFHVPMEKFMNPGFIQQMYERRDMILKKSYEDVFITSFDGLKLYGRYFRQENAKRLLILCHGWKSRWYEDFSHIITFFLESDCNLLIIDERAAGESEGKLVTFGMKEHKDLVMWAKWAREHQDLPVYMYGTSMGAASVLMASDQLSDYAQAIIADSPFIEPYLQLKDFGKRIFHLPEYPFMPIMNIYARIFMKRDLRSISVYDILPACRIPVFVFHGKLDFFCNMEMSRKLKELNPEHVTLFLYPDSNHCASYVKHTEEYQNALLALFNR